MQRIQTLYLFLVIGIGCILFFVPVYIGEGGKFLEKGFSYTKSVEFITQRQLVEKNILKGATNQILKKETLLLTIVDVLIIALALADIVLFFNRVLQLRMVRITVFCALVYLATMFYAIYNSRGRINDIHDHFLIGSMLPLLFPLLLILASRAIAKDMKLVHSAQRLR
jgi:hypothetical protein